jgi:enoyl-CoA hydratase/carnithine racemase
MTVTAAAPRADLAFDDGERIGVLLLDGAPANVLSVSLLRELTAALDRFEAREGRVLVIGSAVPGIFASGGDVDHVSRTDANGFVAYMQAIREVLDRLDGLPCPTIVAIDGAAIGGGLELALACTLRVAGEDAIFGMPQVKLGTIPVAGGTQRLPRIVGHGKALDLLVTGRSVGAEEAYGIGLVDRRAPGGQAMDVAMDLARGIAAGSEPAVSAVRRAAAAAVGESFPKGMAVEAREALALFERGEAQEGFAAFRDKRPPNFA